MNARVQVEPILICPHPASEEIQDDRNRAESELPEIRLLEEYEEYALAAREA